MSIFVTNVQKPSELPDEGEHLAVLADIIELGPVPTEFGVKDRVRFIWLVAQRNTDGNRIAVPYSYNKSLYEKSNLGKVIRIILGRDPGNSFDLEKLLGSNVRLVIEHREHDGRKFAGIAAVLKPRKGDSILAIPADFGRAVNRNGGGNGSAGSVAASPDQSKGRSRSETTADGESRHRKDEPSRGGTARLGGPNIHGMDITDDDVQFPGDDNETIPN